MAEPRVTQGSVIPFSKSKSQEDIKVVSFNARSVLSKFHDIETEVFHVMNYPEIVCISETWLKPDMPDSLLPFHSKYQIFRKDRKLRNGGGVAIMVRNDLNCHLVEYDCLSLVEVLCLRVKCNDVEFFIANF